MTGRHVHASKQGAGPAAGNRETGHERQGVVSADTVGPAGVLHSRAAEAAAAAPATSAATVV